ncbi:MAG: iron ABC transporter permease [Clostridia bacterium]|nr:iron ABC transporter permease [Clostridia bacterium]
MEKRLNRGGSRWWVLLVLGGGLILSALFSVCLGNYGISIGEVIEVVFGRIFGAERIYSEAAGGYIWQGSILGAEISYADVLHSVVWNIRLPRIALAILVGCSLSAAGATYQMVFQNPMASPDILGASSGAAFGAALAIYIGLASGGITTFAFAFGILCVAVVFIIGRLAPGKQITNLILAGIMISSLFSSGTSFIKLVADTTNQLPQITYWLMGSLSATKTGDLLFALIPMAAGLLPLLLLSWRINLLTLGDEQAKTLGVNTSLLRFVVIICATLLTAASVSVSGMIGWVGLVIPHLCRKLVGNDFRLLLPASMLLGGTFLLLTDDLARCLLAIEIPIGILTAVIGAPFFLFLIMRKERA